MEFALCFLDTTLKSFKSAIECMISSQQTACMKRCMQWPSIDEVAIAFLPFGEQIVTKGMTCSVSSGVLFHSLGGSS